MKASSNIVKAVVCAAIFAVLVALAFLVGDSDYHATVVGWAPPIAMLAALALAFGYLQFVKRNLSFSEDTFAQSCQRGNDVQFSVRFSNPTPLFVFKLDAHLVIADAFGNTANTTSTTLTLAPYESQSFGFAMHFDHIGTYEAGLERVVISDFLGLFTVTVPNAKRSSINVTPRLHPVGGIRFSDDALMQASRAAKSVLADSMDYAYSREYVAGDPLKTIHWKLSARADHYMTRLYEQYTNPSVCVVLDFYGPGEGPEQLMTMFDTVVESGLAIADYARSCGFETEMRFCARSGERRVVRRWSPSELPEIVADMPVMSASDEDKAPARDVLTEQMGQGRGQNNLVVCTADLDADMVSLVLAARAHQRAPLLIAIVPTGVVGRERDAYCKPLARLDAVDVPYVVIAHAEELGEVRP
ncbi:MAG: DUF58 domain-containing protein [Eggerthellaceae bacterium]|nr:DUF58 domain-containing protein [Eggerthellaceae bacterium]